MEIVRCWGQPAEGGLEILAIHHAVDHSVADHRHLTYNLDKSFIKEIIVITPSRYK